MSGFHGKIAWKRTSVSTGIFQESSGRLVPVKQLNLRGDEQADLTVHGGPYKAVYGYPSEHYPFWRKNFREADLS